MRIRAFVDQQPGEILNWDPSQKIPEIKQPNKVFLDLDEQTYDNLGKETDPCREWENFAKQKRIALDDLEKETKDQLSHQWTDDIEELRLKALHLKRQFSALVKAYQQTAIDSMFHCFQVYSRVCCHDVLFSYQNSTV